MTEIITVEGRPFASRRFFEGGSFTPEKLDEVIATQIGSASERGVSIVKRAGPALIFHNRQQPVAVIPGDVTMPAGDYDIRVKVEIVDGAIPRVEAVEVTLLKVPDGPPLSARRIQRAGVGSAIRQAVEHLTVALDPEKHTHAAMSPTRGRRPTVDKREVELAAQLWHDAQQRGVPTTRHVQVGLAKRFNSVTTREVARKRVQAARAAGLIPPTDTTRPRLSAPQR